LPCPWQKNSACLSGSDDPEDGTGGGGDSGPEFASAETLQTMLVGNTTFGNFLVDGQFENAFCDYYAPDGTISSVELIGDSREAMSGTYTIEDGQVCIAYAERGGTPVCRQVEARQSTNNPAVWGGDFYGPDGTVVSHVVTAQGDQVERCH